MALRKTTAWTLSLPLLCLTLVFCMGCESKDRVAGTYIAQGRSGEVQLELKSNGSGLWITGTDEISFSWHLKAGDLRINTKEGGVIVGKIQGDSIRIDLPGQRELLFKKAP